MSHSLPKMLHELFLKFYSIIIYQPTHYEKNGFFIRRGGKLLKDGFPGQALPMQVDDFARKSLKFGVVDRIMRPFPAHIALPARRAVGFSEIAQ